MLESSIRKEVVKVRIKMNGDIIFSDDKWIYDWLGWESTCPNDIRNAIAACQPGEKLVVEVNSGGGYVTAGQEIYSLLHGYENSVAEIQSLAGSAAGVAAVGANKVRISPVAMIMIHNVSGGASGDYHEMQKTADLLQNMNAALSQAFVQKSGRELNEILELMDRETWLTANQCIEFGFADEIITESRPLTNASFGVRLTEDIRQKVINEKAKKEADEKRKNQLLKDLDMYGV